MYDVMALAHWHRQFAWQANLNHALHETEQRAKRVSAVEQHDAFAAAVLAREWLASTQGLNAGMFPDLYSKRALTDAMEYLHRAANPPSLSSEIASYFSRMEHLARLRRIAGDNPEAYVGDARARFAKQGTGRLWLIGTLPFLLFLVLVLIGGTMHKAAAAVVFFALLAVPFVVMSLTAHQRKTRLGQEVDERETTGAEYRAFLSSPDGYPWLQRMWAAHRLLFETAPTAPGGPASGRAAPAAQVVIERQVVVARCRFCAQLTPVDRPSCEHCGAAGYGSSQR